jgi:hypothetical protein
MIPVARRGLVVALAAVIAGPAGVAAQQGSPAAGAPQLGQPAAAQPQVRPPAAPQPGQPAVAPQQGVAAQPKRLGRPLPGPVQPPPRPEEPGVHVSVVSPQESRVSRRRMGSGQRQGLRGRGGSASDMGGGGGQGFGGGGGQGFGGDSDLETADE